MRIVCPACTATYEVPTALLKPGLTVRCARCSEEWTPASEEAAEPLEAAEPTPMLSLPPVPAEDVAARMPPRMAPARPVPPPSRTGDIALRAAWVCSVVALVLLVGGAYVERAAIMQLWPPSTRLYAALGLQANH